MDDRYDETELKVFELQNRIVELETALRESEQDMHNRIRLSYDKTVADCWRAEVARKDIELDRLDKIIDQLQDELYTFRGY